MYGCIYVHVCGTRTRIYTYIHIYIYIHICTCMKFYIFTQEYEGVPKSCAFASFQKMTRPMEFFRVNFATLCEADSLSPIDQF